MKIEIDTYNSDLTEVEAFKSALNEYTERFEDKEGYSPYSPAVRLVNKYYVGYRNGESRYWAYEFEGVEDKQP